MRALEFLVQLYMSGYAAPGTVVDEVSIDGATAAIRWSQKSVRLSSGGGNSWVGDNRGSLSVPLATLVSLEMPAARLAAPRAGEGVNRG